MEIGPIWRAMQRNRSSFVLIVLQIAVTMAMVVNAVAIVRERAEMMARDSGIDEDNIFYVNSGWFDPDVDFQAAVAADLDAIRGLPGVANAVMSNTVPLQGGGWGQQFQTEPGEDKEAVGTAIFFVDEQGVDTFAVELVAGRNFRPTEISWFDPDSGKMWPELAIITKELGRDLFPDTPVEALPGKTAYVNNYDPVTIIGVVDRMQAAWKSWDFVENASLIPQFRGSNSARYVVRTEAGQRDQVIPRVESLLAERDDRRIVRGTKTMTEVRRDAYLEDSAMIKLLVFIVTVLVAITGLGVVGLASFNVARRTRQIGTRRALGATRVAILRYFMIEILLVSAAGIVVGGLLAVSLNLWMVDRFNLTPLDWRLIPVAMLTLVLVGQAAVLGPARRASRIAPATATRTV